MFLDTMALVVKYRNEIGGNENKNDEWYKNVRMFGVCMKVNGVVGIDNNEHENYEWYNKIFVQI